MSSDRPHVRVWQFCICYLLVWGLYALPFLSSELRRGDFSWGDFWASDILRVVITLPVVYAYRVAFNRGRWLELASFELVSLTIGFNLVAAIVVAVVVPFSISPSDIWFDLFQRESIATTRGFDETFVSFIYSFCFQVIFCFLYQVFAAQKQRRALEDQTCRAGKELKDARINLLNNQIGPHFLFNSMNNICSLMDEDVGKAQTSLRAFSDLLRFVLDAPNHQRVSFEAEISVVDSFVTVAEIQYESRLRFSRNIKGDIQGYYLPPMSIQLLVENAIKHGVAKRKEGAQVSLLIEEDIAAFDIYVVNEGELRVQADTASSGIGLLNIDERIRLLYGERASFSLTQQHDSVLAHLRIPKDKG